MSQFDEVKGSVSDPVAADRAEGIVASIGEIPKTQAPRESYGQGQHIPEGDGGAWEVTSIQDNLVQAGYPRALANQVTNRTYARKRPGQAILRWLNRASNRFEPGGMRYTSDNNAIIARRRDNPGGFRRPPAP